MKTRYNTVINRKIYWSEKEDIDLMRNIDEEISKITPEEIEAYIETYEKEHEHTPKQGLNHDRF